ncbi:M23 family metallopeptidase [Roseobacteraceae bacterium S113]
MARFLWFVIVLALPVWAQAQVTCDDKEGLICVEAVQTDDGVALYGLNRFALLPVTLTVSTELTNLVSVAPVSETQVLQGGERRLMGRFMAERRGAWRYSYRFEWSRGDMTARHDPDQRYRLPYPDGATYRITQGCDGDFTHHGPQRFGMDFDMDVGDPILAARAGLVVFVSESSNRGGATQDYQDDANFIVIQHGDRTLGQYFHLQRDGAVVAPGDWVRAGDLIGYSGNTGQSTGPHLHFDVVKGAAGVWSETLPITFATQAGAVTCPAVGQRLQARGE